MSQARATVSARLQARRSELEQVALARISSVSELEETTSSDYVEGLREAVLSAIDYALAAIEHDAERPEPVPAVLLQQARLAARSGISLGTVLRRYFAGYTLLGDFLIEEARNGKVLSAAALQEVLRGQATLFDQLVATIAEEYRGEQARRGETAGRRRAEQIEALLVGRPVGTAGIEYDFEANHVGLIGVGAEAIDEIRKAAESLDYRVLLLPREETTVWAWFGARRPIDSNQLERFVSKRISSRLRFAFGEPAAGLGGWRLTHRQARAALPVLMRGSPPTLRYADVALLSSAIQDDVLIASLRSLYLTPLESESDGGRISFETLRAYFAAERNISSAAAILGVSRRTVANRLQRIEARLGHPLSSALSEVEVALQLEDLTDWSNG